MNFAEQKEMLKEVCLNLQTEISSHIHDKQSLKESSIKRLIDQLKSQLF